MTVTMVELSGPDGEPLGSKIDVTQLSPEERLELYRLAERASPKKP